MNIRGLRFTVLAAAIFAALCVVAVSTNAQNQSAALTPSTPLTWAYALNTPATPGGQAAAEDPGPKHVPGTSVSFLLKETRDAFSPPDWHPDSHPPMPEVVAHGRKPDVRACGYCHLPIGQGRPENAPIAGLPAGYIIQQMADYRNGLRKSSEPKMGPPALMLGIGKSANDEEVKAAAEYFSSLKFKPWIRVVETDTVPKTKVSGWMFVALEPAAKEPIGQRIVEMPEDLERTELRDSASSFIAYVPTGSIKKGEALVTTGGGGKTIRCSICHGADLKGLGNVPPLAGRSPSYIGRQLYDIQAGNRNGPWTQLMKEAVSKLTPDDILAIVAYTSSRNP
jgi:cytochrome c553